MVASGRRHPDGLLVEVFRHAQELGFIGPAPLEEQVAHGLAFAEALSRGWSCSPGTLLAPAPRRVADLGSGGGLPALVIARVLQDVDLTLVESQHRRAEFLEQAVRRLDLHARVQVEMARAEVVGRDARHRGSYQAATARSFGPPAVTAECAAPLLRVGGVLVVSEPPPEGQFSDRWRTGELASLGMGPPEVLDARQRRFAVIPQIRACPERFPRRVGVPAKRPLF